MGLDLDLTGDLEDLFEQTIALEKLPEGAKGRRGGPKDTGWTEQQAGIPCLIVPRMATTQERGSEREPIRHATVYTTTAMKLGPTTRLRYDDPAQGPRYLYPTAEINIAEIGQVWTIQTEEFP